MEFDMQVLSTMSSTRACKYAQQIHEKNQIVERKIEYVYHNTFFVSLFYKVWKHLQNHIWRFVAFMQAYTNLEQVPINIKQ
jgi:hypothetical protein